ncbi:MAG: response regulator [Alphaproteobacteria bacterium]|nr:response regulator [Alphaproteobacteria bacterium]
MARVLIIEDDRVFVELMSKGLSAPGHEVVAATNGAEGVDHFCKAPFDVVVTDLVMPDMDGIEAIRKIRKVNPQVGIVAVSGGVPRPFGPNVDYLDAAQHLGADAALKKPFLPSELAALVDRVLVESGRRAASQS